MAFDFSSFQIASHEKPADSDKMNQFINAAEDAVNNLPISSLVGYPSNAALYPDGSGNWSVPAGGSTSTSGGWSTTTDSLSFSSKDVKTFVLNTPSDATTRYSIGNRLRIHQLGETNYRYFIVTGVTATKLTVWGGTDYEVDNSAISDGAGSSERFPLGFPSDPNKWTLVEKDTTEKTKHHNDITLDTWYNVGDLSIEVPIGSWFLSYAAVIEGPPQQSTEHRLFATLSTGIGSESTPDFTSSTNGYGATLSRMLPVLLAAKTTYYLNEKTSFQLSVDLSVHGDITPTYMAAFSAYF